MAETQEQLCKLLKSETVSVIILNTQDDVILTIPKGEYSDKTLIVMTSDTYIANNAIFDHVVIKSATDTTWAEYAADNSFQIFDSNLSMEINSLSQVKRISFETPTTAVDLDDSVNETTNLGDDLVTDVNITVDGKLSELVVNAPSSISLSGDGDLNRVIINEAAVGSKVAVSIDTKLESYASSDIALLVGAENSSIDFLSKVNSRVENLTDSYVTITWLQDYWNTDHWFQAYRQLGANSGLLISPTESTCITKLMVSSIIKLYPSVVSGATATEIVAGQTLANSVLQSTFMNKSDMVGGTIEWVSPASVINTSGYFEWVFTPIDYIHYNKVYGVAYVNVK